MTLLHRLASMLRWIFRRDRVEQALDDELRAYVEMAARDRMRDGVPAGEARRQALLELGGLEQTKEQVRSRRHGAWLGEMARDARYALRMFARTPGFTFVVVLTLALGIGANTAIFGLIDALILRSLPVPRAQELLQVRMRTPGSQRARRRELLLRDRARARATARHLPQPRRIQHVQLRRRPLREPDPRQRCPRHWRLLRDLGLDPGRRTPACAHRRRARRAARRGDQLRLLAAAARRQHGCHRTNASRQRRACDDRRRESSRIRRRDGRFDRGHHADRGDLAASGAKRGGAARAW